LRIYPDIKQGNLAQWLKIVAENAKSSFVPTPVPEYIVEVLTTLRCIGQAEDGSLILTDKGCLALRMEKPGALYIG
jgi:hypothetical protein